MAGWAVIIPAEQWATERLYHHDAVTVPVGASPPVAGAGIPAPGAGSPVADADSPVAGRSSPAADDEVLVVADGGVVALARAAKVDGDRLVLTYLRRAFDAPVPAEALALGAASGVVPVDPSVFRAVAARVGGEPPLAGRTEWLVSVALPIEAGTPAEAVRQFWSHVREMGPAELPTYVWPSGDELAMQVFVLGEEANQDPEEEEEEPEDEED